MSSMTQYSTDRSALLKASATTGIVNAAINGAIQAFLLAGHGPIPLSVDGISSDEHTVLGSAVPLAVALAMILTAIAHLTLKAPKRPFLPGGLWLVAKHGIMAFGAVVSLAVLWQRAVGTVEVGVPLAVGLLAAVAAVVAAAVHYLTITASLEQL